MPLCALMLGGCASLVSSVTSDLADSLTTAMLDNPDPATVRDGAPAYLLLLDALLDGDPDNPDLLLAAAQLNGAYVGGFVDDPARARRLTAKALAMAEAAACRHDAGACTARTRPFAEYEAWLAGLERDDVPVVYAFGTAWAGWLQAHSDDWNAVAELSRVKALMARMAALAPGHDFGGPHLYLGVFETLVPPAMGGKPDKARMHFEEALVRSGGQHQMTRVFYAEQYARLVFDRELHDRLLTTVVEADPAVPGLTLMNALAQDRARALLAEADDYF